MSLVPVYARALLSARRKAAAGPVRAVPTSTVVVPGVAIGPDRALALARATGVPVRRALPVVAPHLLVFAAQLQLMSADDFPFPLPGLVHVEQTVRQHRPLGVGERCEVRVSARGPLPHAKGAAVALDALVLVGDAVVWEGTSTYLARGPSTGPVAGEELPAPTRTAARWRVPDGTGRAYAAVSGDVNPIHLSRLAARALGFRGAIAHGMWTLARALGQVEPRLVAAGGPAVQVRVRWGSPLLLGSRVELCAQEDDDGGWALAVRSGERVHLTAAASTVLRR